MPSSHVIPYPMHLLYSQPHQNPLQPSVRCTTPLPEPPAPLSAPTAGQDEAGRAAGHWIRSYPCTRVQTIRHPEDALLQLLFCARASPQGTDRKWACFSFARTVRYSQNISEYALTSLLHQGGQLSRFPHGPSSRLQSFHAWFDPAGLCPAWREGSDLLSSALNIHKYHLYLWVIKTEEAGKFIARNF